MAACSWAPVGIQSSGGLAALLPAQGPGAQCSWDARLRGARCSAPAGTPEGNVLRPGAAPALQG